MLLEGALRQEAILSLAVSRGDAGTTVALKPKGV